MNRIVVISGLAALTFTASPAAAQLCDDADPVQRSLSYLRRVSLDLSGRVPTLEEQNSVITNGAIDPGIVDAMLDSDDFVDQVRRHHLDLLWTNLSGLRITANGWDLSPPIGRTVAPAYYIQANARRNRYRGGGGAVCLDEPARFDANTGEILTTQDANDPNIRREGWVEVEPYWAPGTRIRVCAFDAQANETVTTRGGAVIDCSRTVNQIGCGCGPNLRWCQSGRDGTVRAITNSMNEQLLRYMDTVVREDRPYSDVVLGKDMQINGPLAFWLNYQSQTGGNTLPAAPLQNFDIPDLGFEEADNWVTVTRNARHAGVLSMPGYLLKFGSNRGRANRFYNAFLCQHFESNEVSPPATDTCHQEPDLTKRCGCKGCHIAVEPAAAHWGRWAEAGLIAMEDPLFPKFNPDCALPNASRRSGLCSLFYFTDRDVTDTDVESPWVGMLRPYVFADATREANIEAGPEAIAQSAVDTGAFANCQVQTMWQRFLSRAPTDDDREIIDTLTADFADGYSMRSLVKAIVTRPEYIEAGLYGAGEE